MENSKMRLEINGQEVWLTASVEQTLLEVLRDQGLVGAKEGCGIGVCGACTVLVDGRAISSCLLLAAQAQGISITTIEGLSDGSQLHPVQQAYIDEAGFQCAYCTSGFILMTIALIADNPEMDDSTIREYLSGNLCRCGSYENIVRAVKRVSIASTPPP